MKDLLFDALDYDKLYDTDIQEDIKNYIQEDDIQAACMLWGQSLNTEY